MKPPAQVYSKELYACTNKVYVRIFSSMKINLNAPIVDDVFVHFYRTSFSPLIKRPLTSQKPIEQKQNGPNPMTSYHQTPKKMNFFGFDLAKRE